MFPPCPVPALGDTPHGLSNPTHLLHLLLVAIGANALKGLLSVVGIPALLLVCLLGLGVWRSMTGGPPRVRLPDPASLVPVGGLWVEWGASSPGTGIWGSSVEIEKGVLYPGPVPAGSVPHPL